MGCVNGIGTIYAAGCDYADRRLLFFHNTDLNGRGLGSEEHIFGDIESVLSISCGVVLRKVECFEVVIIGFNFGTFCDGKAHSEEDILNFVENDVERMFLAGGSGGSRKSYVNGFGSKLLFKKMLMDVFSGLGKVVFNFGADLVCKLADNGSFLCGEFSHLFENGGELAFFAEIADSEFLKSLGVFAKLKSFFRFKADLFKLLFQDFSTPFL